MSSRNSSFTAGIDIKVNDRSSGPLRSITVGFGGLEKAAKKAAKGFSFGNMARALDNSNLGEVADATAKLVAKPIKTFMDFEAQMSKVRAATFSGDTSDEARKGYEELSAAARKLGADTQFSGMEAAQGMEILATQGFKTADQIAAMPGILDVAAASTESIATSADIATAAMTQFGLKATDMGRIGDVLIKTSDGSASGLTDIGEALKYVGSNAGAAGISIEKTTAMIGALSNSGVKGSMAGTAIRAMLSGLQAPTKQGKSALAFLGINPKDKKGNLRPIEDLLTEIDKAMDKKFGVGQGGTRRAALFKAMFGEEAASAGGILARAASGGKLQELIAANANAAGTAAAKAKDVSNNAAGAVKELDSAFEELQITIGEAVVPTIAEWTKEARGAVIGITTWVKENPGLVKGLGILAGSLTAAATATRVLNIVMSTNPVVAIATAIATAAYLIYENWEPISAFFTRHWETIKMAFAPIMPVIEPFIAAGSLIIESWEPIKQFFVDLGATVSGVFAQLVEYKHAAEDLIDPYGAAQRAAERDKVASDEANAAAREATNTSFGALFADDNDRGASLTGRGGLGDYGGRAANDPMAAATSLANFYDNAAAVVGGDAAYGPARPTEEEALAATPMGPAMLSEGGTTSTIFKGDLKITIDSKGQVVGQEMKQTGAPGFEVRANRGGQAA